MRQLSKVWYITLKDIKTYYLKPPLISWGIIFPGAMILAFYLRNPSDFRNVAAGLVGITLLFGSTSMEAVVITFEKRVGTLERLLMAPVKPGAIVLAKLLSGVAFGALTGGVALLLGIVALGLPWGNPLLLLLSLFLSAMAFSALGNLFSTLVREVFEAMTLANFFRFPMVFISGVFTTLETMPPSLKTVALVSPLTYSVDAFRNLMGLEGEWPLTLDLAVMAGFTAAIFLASLAAFKRNIQREY